MLSPYEKQQVVDEVLKVRWPAYSKEHPDVKIEGACHVLAALVVMELATWGVRAVFQAGSAFWPILVEGEPDDGVQPRYFGYGFDTGEALALIAKGTPPEIHCWAAIPTTGELIDVTTPYQPAQAHRQQKGIEFSEGAKKKLPPFVWGTAPELNALDLVYEANVTAINLGLCQLGTLGIFLGPRPSSR